MNKKELAGKVAETTGIKKADAEVVVGETFNEIANALANGDFVNISGFGKFEPRPTEARKARNPQTGAEVDVPASRKPAFKAAQGLKDKVKI